MVKMRQSDTMEVVSIGEHGSRTVSKETLCRIINARVEETFQLVKKELVQAGCHLDSLSSGIVLTGGTAMLSGICQVAQQVLGVPVRVGYPRGVSELGDVHHPRYAGAVGLVCFTAREHGSIKSAGKNAAAGVPGSSCWGIGGKMKQWFVEAF